MNPIDAKLIANHGDVPESYTSWNPSMGVDDFVKTEFTCGACYQLALALHYKMGGQIMAKRDGEDVVHCYIINSANVAVDIYGVRPTNQAPTRFDPVVPVSRLSIVKLEPEIPDETDSYYQWAVDLINQNPTYFGIYAK